MKVSIKSLTIVFLGTLLILTQASWLREDDIKVDQSKPQLAILKIGENLGSSASQWGYGITYSLETSILNIINEGQASYGTNYEGHSKYISAELSKIDSGSWSVFLIPSMTLNQTTDAQIRGFGTYFYALEQKYAILYSECPFNSALSHIIIKVGPNTQRYIQSSYPTTNMDANSLAVVKNTIKYAASYLYALQQICIDVTKNLQAWDNNDWNCIAVDYQYNSQYINAYGVIYNNQPYKYATFQAEFTLPNGDLINVVVWQYYKPSYVWVIVLSVIGGALVVGVISLVGFKAYKANKKKKTNHLERLGNHDYQKQVDTN